MFNFDFRRTAIRKAVRIKNSLFFKAIKPLKVLLSIVTLSFFLVFLANELMNFQPINGSILLGLFLVFLSFTIPFFLAELFFNSKLKNPTLPPLTNVANLAEFLDFKTAKALFSAIKFSKKNNIFPLTPTLLFYFILKQNKEISFLLARLLLSTEAIMKEIPNYLSNERVKDSLSERIYSQKFEQVIKESLEKARKNRRSRIDIGDILVLLAKTEPVFGAFMLEADLRPDDIENVVSLWQEEEEKKKRRKRFWTKENLARQGSLGRTWASSYTITLDEYSKDLVYSVFQGGDNKIIGYKSEIEQTERILSSPGMNNVLLIGEPGVGVKNVIKAVAVKGSKGQSLPTVNYQRVLELNIPQMLARLKSFDEVEDKLDQIFQEVARAGNVILVIDDFHNFVGGREQTPGTIDITGLLASYLELPQFRIVAITSYKGLHKKIEENPSILNLFSKIEVKEPDIALTLKILQRIVPQLENKYGKLISYMAVKEVIELCDKYITDKPFPKKAEEVLEQSLIRIINQPKQWLLPEDVDKFVAQKTEIPVGNIKGEEKDILLDLENLIHQRIINQAEAVKDISTALRRARANLKERKGLMGGFLFLGPTGVGKTETSKALADIYFGSEKRMIRLDMSEFQSQRDIPRLLGSEGEEGLLTTPVRESPFSLILLDEIEKAHPNILNLFLQVLDEGHITDGLGRKVNFSNTIIIATSNAGYKIILQALEEKISTEETKQKLLDYIFEKSIFRPEFINRFNAVVVFKPLSRQNLLDISQLMLNKIRKGLEEKNIEFIITEELKEKIVKLGYDITFGARNLQRTIQDKVENPLAEALLRGDIKKGDSIEISAVNFKVRVI